MVLNMYFFHNLFNEFECHIMTLKVDYLNALFALGETQNNPYKERLEWTEMHKIANLPNSVVQGSRP